LKAPWCWEKDEAMAMFEPEPAPRSLTYGSLVRLFVGVWLAFLLLAFGGAPNASASDLASFIGSYVGRATVEDVASGQEQLRDLDIVVVPHGANGLQIDWVTVGLVEGRRDVPGVKRWAQRALFEPSDDGGFMIEVGDADLFREREATVPIKGDPVRWTRLDGDTLHTYSFVVLEDGRYEMQHYQRILTDIGMDIRFERVVDGQTIRRVSGTTARAG
jgi:hypothetical protein